jgi:tmRNA-binding protein
MNTYAQAHCPRRDPDGSVAENIKAKQRYLAGIHIPHLPHHQQVSKRERGRDNTSLYLNRHTIQKAKTKKDQKKVPLSRFF